MDQWLVRTSKNNITGPYSKEELCDLIIQKHIGAHDEICKANEFWFYLDEESELIHQLGIRLPKNESLPHEDNSDLHSKSEETVDIQLDTTARNTQEKSKMKKITIETIVTWRILVWILFLLVIFLFYLTIREIQKL